MVNFATQHDIGAFLKTVLARVPEVITAGAGNDGVEVSGPWIDRLAYASLMLSCKVSVPWRTTMASGETLTIAFNLRDATSSGGVGAADYGTAYAATVQATGPQTNLDGVAEADFDLGGARQFIQLQSTVTLSASGTDTARVAGVIVLGGADIIPAA